MSAIRFTDQQERAITERNSALLVSAAAGSGKTAVLIERVLRYLEAGGDVQRLLITTFTQAAAEELRLKLKRAVEARAAAGGDHMVRQSTLVESAEIGTVHSVCLQLITRHFEQLELDPRCRLMDESAAQTMIQEETERLLEELYGDARLSIRQFLSCYATGRSDDTLQGLLIDGLSFLEEQPLPEDYIRQALEPYRRTDEGLFACFREDGLYQYIALQLDGLLAEYDFLVRFTDIHPYLRNFPLLRTFVAAERQQLDALPAALQRRDYDGLLRSLEAVQFEKLYIDKLTEKDGDKIPQEQFKKRRDLFKKHFSAFRQRFSAPEAEELRRLREQGALLETYFEICMQLKERLEQARRRQGWITYQDMEQMAVRLLVERYDPETDTLTPTPLALQLQQDYDEIIVDEFQDTNRAQDLIFRALSRKGENLFMVGDLKQSIYRFRGAEPEIFEEKRRQAAAGKDLRVLELNANFRSHPGVLRFVNRVFGALMSPRLGGVQYDTREELTPGGDCTVPEACCAELHWMEPETDPATGRSLETMQQNARYAAALIAREVRERRPLILPDGSSRPVCYNDYVILLRTADRTAAVFEQELQRAGIPVENRNKSGPFYDRWEVQSILSYLLVLSNPYDDVALVSLLYGDYFRFSVGELAALRDKKEPLYDNLRRAAVQGGKVKAAFETIERFRRLAGAVYVYDLLWRIYEESGVRAAYMAEKEGAEQCANLDLLAEEARRFEQDGYRGLYAFVQHIRLNASKTQRSAQLQTAADRVRIMTIHKSKGLEFPICILGDVQKKVNLRDRSGRLLLHAHFGAAAEHQDPALYFRCPSLAQAVLADQIVTDTVSEEERVLYVALTRAQCRLVLLTTVQTETVEGWAAEGVFLGQPLPVWLIRRQDAGFGRWLISLLAAAPEGAALRARFGLPQETQIPPLGVALICADPTQAEQVAAVAETPPVLDRTALHTRLDWRYPHAAAVRLPAKLSVSELKGLREPEEDAQPLFEVRTQAAQPRFSPGFTPPGNEIGNALHQALQFSDFERLRQDPAAELDRLVERGFILERQRALIPLDKLRSFTESDSFRRLLEADWYSKEERFLFPVPAAELFGPEAEGEILIQGVLDCYSVQGDEAVILDYKTDRVRSAQELIDRYRVQMEFYTQALQKVRGLKVIRREIYSFSLEETICL